MPRPERGWISTRGLLQVLLSGTVQYNGFKRILPGHKSSYLHGCTPGPGKARKDEPIKALTLTRSVTRKPEP